MFLDPQNLTMRRSPDRRPSSLQQFAPKAEPKPFTQQELETFAISMQEQDAAYSALERKLRDISNAEQAAPHLGQQGMAQVTGTGRQTHVRVGDIEGTLEGSPDAKLGERLPVDLAKVNLGDGEVSFKPTQLPAGSLGDDQWFICSK